LAVLFFAAELFPLDVVFLAEVARLFDDALAIV